MVATNQFVFGTENECLTAFSSEVPDLDAVAEFLKVVQRKFPALNDVEGGVFTPYGRGYIDTGYHLELASIECDAPHQLPLFVEQQQEIARIANDELKKRGHTSLILANNNHSGLFEGEETPIWGAHENYCVEEHPDRFSQLLIPFLATRVYAGAGVIEARTGRYLASVRAARMRAEMNGDTTGRRSIVSTPREAHMDRELSLHRLHIICGDGHRSNFNLALQFAATALAVKAVLHNPDICQRIPDCSRFLPLGGWTTVMRECNVLAEVPWQTPQVAPVVIEIQRIYLDGALEYAAATKDLPDWVETWLCHWDQTLTAMENGDNSWLAKRLDTWIKYELFTRIIEQSGHSWHDLLSHPQLLAQLALIAQNYHEFTDPHSIFNRLESSGLLNHRLGPYIPPGQEAEPFIPDTRTRAALRARFIRDHAPSAKCSVGWSLALDQEQQWSLGDPFATELTPIAEREPRTVEIPF